MVLQGNRRSVAQKTPQNNMGWPGGLATDSLQSGGSPACASANASLQSVEDASIGTHSIPAIPASRLQ